MADLKEFRQAIRKLRKRLPTIWPVKVRRRKDIARDSYAGTEKMMYEDGSSYFLITIDAKLNYSLAKHFLVHEYAHCLSYDASHPDLKNHPLEFGVAYAKAYHVVFDD